jgi:radical SAM superfamily enzyme YgiQ (UPF0313 family)
MSGLVRLMGQKALMPCSALATLVALTPDELGVEYMLCDENVAPIDWDLRCDLVAVTGYSVHAARIAEICQRFRARGIPVALGGIHATMQPDDARKLADHLFLGEAEYTWPEFLRDWVAGTARSEYRQIELVDMADSPPPDWSLVRGSDYVFFTVQTTRGCPHHCDFCEVVNVFGRTFRHKSVDRIMVELRAAGALAEEGVFFSDDNFVVSRGFTKELLQKVIEYNTSRKNPLSFATQATVNIGEDEDLLRMMADARFELVFLGVESPRRVCLEEIGKHHVARVDPVAAVNRISRHGITPIVGLICGFDHDDPSTFDELRTYLDSTASPISVVSLMNAVPGTPLHARLAAEGRILDQFGGEWFFWSNIVPRSMTLQQLVDGHQKLMKELYEPAAFHDRLRRWLFSVGYMSPLYSHGRVSWPNLQKAFSIVLGYLRAPRVQRRAFFLGLRDIARYSPTLVRPYMKLMAMYWHFDQFVEHATWQTVADEKTSVPLLTASAASGTAGEADLRSAS